MPNLLLKLRTSHSELDCTGDARLPLIPAPSLQHLFGQIALIGHPACLASLQIYSLLRNTHESWSSLLEASIFICHEEL